MQFLPIGKECLYWSLFIGLYLIESRVYSHAELIIIMFQDLKMPLTFCILSGLRLLPSSVVFGKLFSRKIEWTWVKDHYYLHKVWARSWTLIYCYSLYNVPLLQNISALLRQSSCAVPLKTNARALAPRWSIILSTRHQRLSACVSFYLYYWLKNLENLENGEVVNLINNSLKL